MIETSILELMFPEGILEYFVVTDYKKDTEKYNILFRRKES